jgi:hypothetical protein
LFPLQPFGLLRLTIESTIPLPCCHICHTGPAVASCVARWGLGEFQISADFCVSSSFVDRSPLDMTHPPPLTLAAILSDLGSLRACPPALRAGVLSENGTGLSALPESEMVEEDELVEEKGHVNASANSTSEATVEQVKELLRLKKRVEVWIKPEGEGARSLKHVEEVEEKVREALVEMSQYVDV